MNECRLPSYLSIGAVFFYLCLLHRQPWLDRRRRKPTLICGYAELGYGMKVIQKRLVRAHWPWAVYANLTAG